MPTGRNYHQLCRHFPLRKCKAVTPINGASWPYISPWPCTDLAESASAKRHWKKPVGASEAAGFQTVREQSHFCYSNGIPSQKALWLLITDSRCCKIKCHTITIHVRVELSKQIKITGNLDIQTTYTNYALTHTACISTVPLMLIKDLGLKNTTPERFLGASLIKLSLLNWQVHEAATWPNYHTNHQHIHISVANNLGCIYKRLLRSSGAKNAKVLSLEEKIKVLYKVSC